MILIKGNGQRIGDIAAGTTVISEKVKVSIDDTIMKDLPLDYMPTYSQVTVFNDTDIQTVKNLYDEAIYKGNHNIVLNISARLQKVMQVETKETPINSIKNTATEKASGPRKNICKKK